ncbi:MAG: amino acid ABC transporter permease [Candidatus Bipolaricaulis sp.]|uniref:Polar amino acid ABC transporter, inner membrane subunit n=1 Tax=Candidatus Bipolaricaulis anaerobius TaxID=2026885 RepID=A0A2X3KJ38_9BACT|nr:amino acid ABC transporter permease [Candidatus Bipolaricaulis anaerobius]SQD92382.1 Polar amino acid ABC transporter, inner membrane subunit [Candidatus Bipolaricaulis anaerobius]
MTLESWSQLWPKVPVLLQGLAVNLELLAGLLSLGLVIGVVVALVEVYAPRPFRALALAYEWFFRGVPELVLLFLFYFGPSQFGVEISAFLAAVLALGFRSSAYQSQIFRGAIQTISPGQSLAARSLGMSRLGVIRHVILPQALRLSLAGWSNEFSSVLKDTTLAYGIGVVEVMRQARYLTARNFPLALPAFIVVALMFLILTYAGNWGIGLLERRLRVPGLEVRG